MSAWPMGLGRDLHFSCGRSGHCVGGLWFHIWDSGKSCFYSGDYQPGPLAFAVDQVKGRRADLAIVDCAHPDTQEDARALRSRILEWIGPCIADGRRVVLPLPRYGRGLELIALIKENFPQAEIAADQGFTAAVEQVCGYGEWLRAGREEQIRAFLEEQPEKRLERDVYDILLLGDTHLEQERCRSLAERELARGGLVIITGRVKPGGFVQTLLDGKRRSGRIFPTTRVWEILWRFWSKIIFRPWCPFIMDAGSFIFRLPEPGRRGDWDDGQDKAAIAVGEIWNVAVCGEKIIPAFCMHNLWRETAAKII